MPLDCRLLALACGLRRDYRRGLAESGPVVRKQMATGGRKLLWTIAALLAAIELTAVLLRLLL
jgi:hypothetical protein